MKRKQNNLSLFDKREHLILRFYLPNGPMVALWRVCIIIVGTFVRNIFQ